MASYFAQVTLLPASGNSEDVQVNGLAAGQIGTLDQTYANQWTTAIKAMYDDLDAANAINGSAQNNHIVKFYEIGQPQPNYPVFETTFNLTSAPSATDLPQEVALCISYANVSATTVPRARRRGRIYISGWAKSSVTAGRPTGAAMQAALDSFTDYVVAFNALGSLNAGIWSRTNGTVYEIETAWVDDEFDTMRSRGGKATTRDTWILP